MSGVELRIELPAYSHSFTVTVPPDSTVHHVKLYISRECPGQPHIQGQRLISRGRILRDEERIDDLWKASSDSRILHLAIHPSAWTGDPPPISQRPSVSPLPPARTINDRTWSSPESLSSTKGHRPIPYVVLIHQNALSALTSGIPPPLPTGHDDLRQAAVNAVKQIGWIWPFILDSPYPAATSAEGSKYEKTTIHGQPYLSLQSPTAAPTPVQRHALEVLSYTFTLLEINIISTSIARTTTSTLNVPRNGDVNRLLQQYGLPQLRAGPNANVRAGLQLRDIPLRPLLMPLAMLIFRAVLLLYFVAPIRKPVFGILFLAWILYELWQPIRNGLIVIGRIQPDANNDPQPNANEVLRNGNVPNNQPQQRPPGINIQAFGPAGVRQWGLRLGNVFDSLADLNLQAEQQILAQADHVAISEPGIGHKIASFFGLFVATLHPALWNRRRAALRRREGPIRTEANLRQQPDPPSEPLEEQEDESRSGQQIDTHVIEAREELRARHARRPEWVQRYIERVVAEEWVEDMD